MTITVLTIVIIVIAVVVLALALFLFRAIPGVQAYVNLRGQRLVTCPETQSAAAVEAPPPKPPWAAWSTNQRSTRAVFPLAGAAELRAGVPAAD